MAVRSLCEAVIDPISLLIAIITEQLAPAQVIVKTIRSTPWASATFSGARHEVALMVTGPLACERARAFVANAPDVDFDVDDQIIVDIDVPRYQISGQGVDLTIECLSVEAA